MARKRPKRPPASPAEVKAAVRWFRSRTAVTSAEWNHLSAKAKAQAFTIGGTTQLNVVQTALDVMRRAMAKQHGFAEFKEALRKKLGDDFTDKNSARLRTSFQTHTQIALNTGRWYELQSPELVRKQPYRIYDATLDERTTDLCWKLDGTIVAHDSPFLATHWPPLHWNCRTQIRALSAAQAARYGGPTPKLHLHAVPEAMGYAPPLREDFTPDPDKYDPHALSLANQRAYRRVFKDVLEGKQQALRAARNAEKAAYRKWVRDYNDEDDDDDFRAEADAGFELYNPNHDARGRFASGSGAFRASGVVGIGPVQIATPAALRDAMAAASATVGDFEATEHPFAASHVDALLAAAGVSPKRRLKAEQWSRQWVEEGAHHTREAQIAQAFAGLKKSGSWAQAQYEATQAVLRQQVPELQRLGVVDAQGYIRVYRGLNRDQAAVMKTQLRGTGEAPLEVRPLSSWTDSHGSTTDFAPGVNDVVVTTRIHHSRVFAAHHGQAGHWKHGGERELVILAETQRVAVVREIPDMERILKPGEELRAGQDVGGGSVIGGSSSSGSRFIAS